MRRAPVSSFRVSMIGRCMFSSLRDRSHARRRDDLLELKPEASVWLVKGANYAIAPGLVLADDALVDEGGHRFPLNATGRLICELGHQPADVGTVIGVLTALTGMPEIEVRDQVVDFLAELSRRGLVSIHQSFVQEAVSTLRSLPLILSAARIDHSLIFRGRFPLRRYAANARAVVAACLEAHQGIMLIGLALTGVSLLALGSQPVASLNMLYRSTAPHLAAAVLSYFLVLILVVVTHEFGHYVAARLQGTAVQCVYARQGAAGLLYREDRPRAAVRVVVAGPAAGFAVVLLVAGVSLLLGPGFWLRFGLDQLQLSWYAALAVIALHQLMGFVPLTKDGRELLRVTRGAALTMTGAP